jgi:hypothetical protein
MHHLEMKQFAHSGLDLLNAGITKFNHLTTLYADQVIMLFKAIRLFVLGQVLSKLMLGDQLTVDQ